MQRLTLFFGCFNRCLKRDKLKRLYERGTDKIEKYLDVVKLVNRLRQLKIMTKILISKEIIHQQDLFNSRKVILDIDSSDKEDINMD